MGQRAHLDVTSTTKNQRNKLIRY